MSSKSVMGKYLIHYRDRSIKDLTPTFNVSGFHHCHIKVMKRANRRLDPFSAVSESCLNHIQGIKVGNAD